MCELQTKTCVRKAKIKAKEISSSLDPLNKKQQDLMKLNSGEQQRQLVVKMHQKWLLWSWDWLTVLHLVNSSNSSKSRRLLLLNLIKYCRVKTVDSMSKQGALRKWEKKIEKVQHCKDVKLRNSTVKITYSW